MNICVESQYNRPKLETNPRFAWFDVRDIKEDEILKGMLKIITQIESCAVVVDESSVDLVPASIRKVGFVYGNDFNIDSICSKFDVIILEPQVIMSEWYFHNKNAFTKQVGTTINVVDQKSLQTAVQLTRQVSVQIVYFKDETKIPLEIVLAASQNNQCSIVMYVDDADETRLVFGVLECGVNGVLVQADNISRVLSIYNEVKYCTVAPKKTLVELTVERTFYAGMGDRACIDLTSELRLDEGIIVGSFSNGGILACSETHPLPYMQTRPFRVNAGALHSYVLAPNEQTWYLSDLRAGMEVLAVSTQGEARPVVVGRVKIERRPILCIEARDSYDEKINVFMQADWHVRVFGCDGLPRNITTLKSGDRLLGFTMESGRHVGVKVNEKINEQ